MPLYAYRCKECGHEFEQHQRMSEDPLTECPVCQGNVRRVINSVGVVFKGSGFYVTDNKATNPAAPTKVGEDGGSKSDGDSAGTTEKKPGQNGAASPAKEKAPSKKDTAVAKKEKSPAS